MFQNEFLDNPFALIYIILATLNMPDFEIDNLTLFLLISAVILLLYSRFSRPTALVHPLLLGKQAEVSPVRKEGESGVYRSFATGHGTPVS